MHLSAIIMIFVVRSVLGYYPPQRYNDVCEDDGKTDCASKISLCTDELFGEMMRAHCKKTCGLCGNEEDEEYYEQVGGGGGSNAGEGDGTEDYTEESQTAEETTDPSDEDEYPTDEETEQELPVPVIRPMACADTSADCKDKLDLCHRPQYRSLMMAMCQRTCNLCHLDAQNLPRGPGEPRTLASLLTCLDQSTDCAKRAEYCTDPAYMKLMSEVCRRTCSLC